MIEGSSTRPVGKRVYRQEEAILMLANPASRREILPVVAEDIAILKRRLQLWFRRYEGLASAQPNDANVGHAINTTLARMLRLHDQIGRLNEASGAGREDVLKQLFFMPDGNDVNLSPKCLTAAGLTMKDVTDFLKPIDSVAEGTAIVNRFTNKGYLPMQGDNLPNIKRVIVGQHKFVVFYSGNGDRVLTILGRDVPAFVKMAFTFSTMGQVLSMPSYSDLIADMTRRKIIVIKNERPLLLPVSGWNLEGVPDEQRARIAKLVA